MQKCAHTKKNNHINPSISPYKPVCAKNHADFRLKDKNVTTFYDKSAVKKPFKPTEQEIDDLIAASPSPLAVFLQLLKETGSVLNKI